VAGGRISGGPGGPTPCHGAARLGPRHHVVWRHGGSPWGVPGASLPHFLSKKFKNNFLEFFKKLYFRGFLDIDK
jgi:hypothetical protein